MNKQACKNTPKGFLRRGRIYLPPSAAADGLPPFAEGGEGWRRSRHKLLFRVLRTRGGGRSPSGSFPIASAIPSAPLTFGLVPYPTLAGRGGSVSRRDHNQAAGNRAELSGGSTYAEATPPNASRSSGEGVWGGGASLREAASSPESLPPHQLFAIACSRKSREMHQIPAAPTSV